MHPTGKRTIFDHLMSRYILLQYNDGQASQKLSSISGTFSELEAALAIAESDSHSHNEIIDRDTWRIVWSLKKAIPLV
jgi:hypothetical protein